MTTFSELDCILEQWGQSDQARMYKAERVLDRFEAERAHLKPLPALDYPCCRREESAVGSYSEVRVGSNRYSVPVAYAHRSVSVLAYPERIEVLCQGEVIARHEKSYGQNRDILDPTHYIPLLERRPALSGPSAHRSQIGEKAPAAGEADRWFPFLLQPFPGGHKSALLIVDELGYVPLTQEGAQLLFGILSQRYERASVIVTTNLEFSEWVQLFAEEKLTAALLDRLTHRCQVPDERRIVPLQEQPEKNERGLQSTSNTLLNPERGWVHFT